MYYILQHTKLEGWWRSEVLEGDKRHAKQAVISGFLIGEPREAVGLNGEVIFALDAQGNDATLAARRYILWDLREGEPPRNEHGGFLTSGAMGAMPADSVYLTAYAQYADARRPRDLEYVGDRIRNVRYNLSGTSGTYDVIRVG